MLRPWLLPPLALAAACSSNVSPRFEPIALATTPPSADCTVEYQGKVVARPAPTPVELDLRPSRHPLIVTCRLPGFAPTPFVIAGERSEVKVALYLGLTGPYGLLLGAANDDLHRYPKEVAFALLPERLPDTRERDALVDARMAAALAVMDAAVESVRGGCAPTDPGDCERQLAAPLAAREAVRLRFETLRQDIAIGGT